MDPLKFITFLFRISTRCTASFAMKFEKKKREERRTAQTFLFHSFTCSWAKPLFMLHSLHSLLFLRFSSCHFIQLFYFVLLFVIENDFNGRLLFSLRNPGCTAMMKTVLYPWKKEKKNCSLCFSLIFELTQLPILVA